MFVFDRCEALPGGMMIFYFFLNIFRNPTPPMDSLSEFFSGLSSWGTMETTEKNIASPLTTSPPQKMAFNSC